MRISKLSMELQDEVYPLYSESFNGLPCMCRSHMLSLDLREAFMWSDSPQGFDYWHYVNSNGTVPLPEVDLSAFVNLRTISIKGGIKK